MLYTIETNDKDINLTIKVSRGAVAFEIYNSLKPSDELEAVNEGPMAAGENLAEKLPTPLPRPRQSAQGCNPRKDPEAGLLGTSSTPTSRLSYATIASVDSTAPHEAERAKSAEGAEMGVAMAAKTQWSPDEQVNIIQGTSRHHRSGYGLRVARKGQKRIVVPLAVIDVDVAAGYTNFEGKLESVLEPALPACEVAPPARKLAKVSARSKRHDENLICQRANALSDSHHEIPEIYKSYKGRVEMRAATDPERVTMVQQGTERAEQSWMAVHSAVALAVEYAAAHAISEAGSSGFMLYGGRAINSYIGLKGLMMRSDDFDFKVVADTSAGWVEQVQQLLDAVNASIGKPLCELRFPAEFEYMAALFIAGRRKVDLMWMPTSEFKKIRADWGQPVRAGADWVDLGGCKVAPAEWLVSLMQVQPEWVAWRKEKSQQQYDTVLLAKELGVWSIPHVLSAFAENLKGGLKSRTQGLESRTQGLRLDPSLATRVPSSATVVNAGPADMGIAANIADAAVVPTLQGSAPLAAGASSSEAKGSVDVVVASSVEVLTEKVSQSIKPLTSSQATLTCLLRRELEECDVKHTTTSSDAASGAPDAAIQGLVARVNHSQSEITFLRCELEKCDVRHSELSSGTRFGLGRAIDRVYNEFRVSAACGRHWASTAFGQQKLTLGERMEALEIQVFNNEQPILQRVFEVNDRCQMLEDAFDLPVGDWATTEHGKETMAIRKTLEELKGNVYSSVASNVDVDERFEVIEAWIKDCYRCRRLCGILPPRDEIFLEAFSESGYTISR
jgi:hypothetical protein